MTIGINATAAVKQPRTGVEEYAYQLIKHLTMLPEAKEHRFLLYLPKENPSTRTNDYVGARSGNNTVPLSPERSPAPCGTESKAYSYFDFTLPENFEAKQLSWPLPMWTQVRLASHLAFSKPDVLFIPVHILPFSHPKNSVVTIHGLEYEYFLEYYPFWFRQYLRFSTRYAVKNARKIIAVSENTKRDLVKFYGADAEKISVVHHGISLCHSGGNRNPDWMPDQVRHDRVGRPYLLYIGRIELKKNILGILEAYKILKEKYKIPHELVLVGVPGFGYNKIKSALTENCSPSSLRRTDLRQIYELGYVSETQKQELLRGADVFLFPTFYEGFGMPILEAQSAGIPVVTSNNSSIPEVAGESALLVDPKESEQIVQAVYKIIDDKTLRDKLIQSGFENIKRFSWEQCARETLDILCA